MEPGFLDSLRGTSLDQVELIMAIEEVFGEYVPPEDERKIRIFRTIQEVLDYIERRKKGGDLN